MEIEYIRYGIPAGGPTSSLRPFAGNIEAMRQHGQTLLGK